MQDMHDDEEELVLVEQELESLEQELATLLARQSHLQERRRELQRALYLDDSEAADGSSTSEPAQDWKAEFEWTSRVHALLRDQVRAAQMRDSSAASAWRLTGLCC